MVHGYFIRILMNSYIKTFTLFYYHDKHPFTKMVSFMQDGFIQLVIKTDKNFLIPLFIYKL